MATKSEIQNLIDINLADESNIEAVEHREVENAFLNELFPEIISETNLTPSTILQPLISSIQYNVQFAKFGRFVYVFGEIRTQTVLTTSQSIFNIINPSYVPSIGTRILAYRNAIINGDLNNRPTTILSFLGNGTILANQTFQPVNATTPAIGYFFNSLYIVNP